MSEGRLKLTEGYKWWDCVCPTCGKHHEVWMNWTDRIPPKKYCHAHRQLVEAGIFMITPSGCAVDLETMYGVEP